MSNLVSSLLEREVQDVGHTGRPSVDHTRRLRPHVVTPDAPLRPVEAMRLDATVIRPTETPRGRTQNPLHVHPGRGKGSL